MKRTPSKLVALLLALILCISAVYVTAFASEDVGEGEAAQPKIISQNVMYGGNFSLMFAVDASTCSGDTVTLKVYDAEPTADATPVWSSTISTAADTTAINGIECFTFTTPGVAAKDMDKNYYITATSAGVVSEVKKYSVAEYLYERLYGNEVAFGTSALELAQAKLYFSTLEFGKNAQDLLFNYDEDTTNDRTTFVTDLCYLVCKPGVKGAYGLFDGKSSAILVDGSEAVNLIAQLDKEYTALNWDVKYIDEDGNVTVGRGVPVTGVKPTSHMIITPSDVAATPIVYDFDNATSVANAALRTSVGETTQVSLGSANGSAAAKVYLSGLTDAKKYYETLATLEGATTATKIIYQADVTLPEGATGTFYYHFRASTYTYKLNVVMSESNYTLSDGWGNSFGTIETGTFNIRMEYYTVMVDGVEKLTVDTFINDRYLAKNKVENYALTVGTNNPAVVTSLYNVYPNTLPAGTEIYFDNIVTARLTPASVANKFDDPAVTTFDNVTSLDETNITSALSNTASIVAHENGNAIKVDFSSTAGTEKLTITPEYVENADVFIFEADITNMDAADTVGTDKAQFDVQFFVNDSSPTTSRGILYDFRINGTVFMCEGGGQFIGSNPPADSTTYRLRIEIRVAGEALSVKTFIDDIEITALASVFGKSYTHVTSGMTEGTISAINRVVITDSRPGANGTIYYDNIKCQAVVSSK